MIGLALPLGVVALNPVPTLGQEALPKPPPSSLRLPQTRPPDHYDAVLDLKRRLIELDRLLTLGSLGRAETLLASLAQHEALTRELVPHRIRLAQLQGDHAAAVAICREALGERDDNPRLWRDLTVSLIALGDFDAAATAIDRFVATSPNRRSSLIVSINLLREGGGCPLAVILLDSVRTVLAEPRFLGRERALCLIDLGRLEEGADELSAELRAQPFNLSLARKSLVEGTFDAARSVEFIARLEARSEERAADPAEAILVANLYLQSGDAEQAVAVANSLLRDPEGCLGLLQNTTVLTRELPLIEADAARLGQLRYLTAVLERLGTDSHLVANLKPRALASLARVCEAALALGDLGDDPRASVVEYERLLMLVKRAHPQSPQLYAAQIRLAHYTRDVLREPIRAANRLEMLLTDLDLPTEGVALARLTLGECYLAAGDTARGRLVLTSLGRDPDFREAAGHAHFHLSRLDLAEGHYTTARDRFATVALDNPAAPYANDALELGLAVAEEMDNPTGGPALLDLYARTVYFDVTAQPDSQLVALEGYVAAALRQVDLGESQHLLERARFELAAIYLQANRTAEALAILQQIVLEHPDGRHPAAALALRGEVLSERGEAAAARDEFERLLLQYPDYLFADDVRDHLRSLP